MPYDSVSIVVAAAAGSLMLCACRRSLGVKTRLGCILLAAVLIRLDPAWQHSLHTWDERYHALVAKNLTTDPLKPTLYKRALLPYDYRNWGANHVWLHKPPGALWLMAGAMRLFGVDEIVMRMPSVLLSTAAVLLTFLIGRMMFDTRTALLAAGFHAVNGFLVALASGRRVADHVDTALIFFVELGILMALTFQRERNTAALALAGAALGAALLSKSFPGLLVAVVAFALFVQHERPAVATRRAAAILAVGLAVAAPWAVYTWRQFPVEARWSALYTLRHATQVVEGQQTDWSTYVRDMPRFFGDLIWIPMVAAVIYAIRNRDKPDLRTIVIWFAIPYLTFSALATRLPSYVMIAAPAVFLLQAWFWIRLRDEVPRISDRRLRVAAVALLVVLAVLPARHLLEPTGAFERRDRYPAATRELQQLSSRLRLSEGVIFNIPSAIEAMFYSPYTAYEHLPSADDVRRVRAAGLDVIVYEPAGTRVDVPQSWNVIVLKQAVPE